MSSTEVQKGTAPQGLTLKQKQQTVSDLLTKFQGSIAQALPRHLTPDRMIRVALTAMTRQPALLDCTHHSLISAVMTAGQLGLMPDSVLGECYLIPFNNTKKRVKECQIIIGYRGLCALAMRSGQVKSVQARAVFLANGKVEETGEEGDFFEYELGLEEVLKHKPSGLKDDRYITHFYAIVKFNNGGHVLNVMTREEVQKIRDTSKNYMFADDKPNSIWGKYFEEMGCKTVLRRLMKYVPLSPDLQRAVGIDEQADLGRQNQSIEILNDPATDEEMGEAIQAEIVDEYNQEQQEAREEEVKKSTTKSDEKVSEANAQLEALLKKKEAEKGKTAGSK